MTPNPTPIPPTLSPLHLVPTPSPPHLVPTLSPSHLVPTLSRPASAMFGGITIADLRKGHISKRRNPLIADLFRRIEMVEAWGRGMPLILEHEPDVEFKEIAGIFIAAFGRPSYKSGFREEHSPVGKTRGKKVGETAGKDGRSVGKTPGKVPEQVRERFGKGSGKSSGKILDLLEQDGTQTIPQLAEQIGITPRAIEKNIKKLQEFGLLRRMGGRKEGHWEVLK